jgi:hypothetical protein
MISAHIARPIVDIPQRAASRLEMTRAVQGKRVLKAFHAALKASQSILEISAR